MSYRAYVTDSLRYAAQNKYLTARWAERYKAEDTRTGDEIALEVIKTCGLKLGD